MDYAAILVSKYAGTEWVLNGDDYDGLEWLSDSAKPSKSELEKLWPEVQKQIQDAAVAREKAKESALKKLEKLGLTQDEIATLIGS